jgi:hypothetical protein
MADKIIIDGIVIDENWITPAGLSRELKIKVNVVQNWIDRGLIEAVTIPGNEKRRYLVDRRTIPHTSPNNAGRPKK